MIYRRRARVPLIHNNYAKISFNIFMYVNPRWCTMPKIDPLARKRQYVLSLTHSTRFLQDENFLKPVSADKSIAVEKDCDG
jgi:hypothetical protein